ncbi:MAG: TolC family protein [Epsilonproteobacteria bacterium]|nr:TolC family protein [Campylobacterota bacterium]
MKSQSTLVTLISLLWFTSVQADDTSLLSPEKQNYFQQQQHQIDATYEKLRYDWLSPINLNASSIYEKSASFWAEHTRKSLSAGIAQDLFRSGGITYAIDYAHAKKESDSLALGKEIAGISQQLMNAVLTYRKNEIARKQSDLKLKNAQIEIFLKRKQYEAGDIDITFLNNALMNQSNELKNNTSLRYALEQQKFEAAKLTDLPIDSLSVPRYTLTQKETFLEQGWEVRYANALAGSAAQQYGQVKSSYLPKLTFIADVGYQQVDSQSAPSSGYRGNFYDAGLQLSMPLAYNASATSQEAQAAYLKQQAQSADAKRQMNALYDQTVALVESYRQTISITQNNLNYYDELLGATKAAVKAGYKAGYDLQTLQNTRAIEELEIQINEINIQIQLSQLHYQMQHPQESL